MTTGTGAAGRSWFTLKMISSAMSGVSVILVFTEYRLLPVMMPSPSESGILSEPLTAIYPADTSHTFWTIGEKPVIVGQIEMGVRGGPAHHHAGLEVAGGAERDA